MAKSLHVCINSMYYSSSRNRKIIIENLQIDISNVISILGPSGCGKTTLLRIISGLERNFDGQVVLGDKLIEKPTRDIQIVFQDSRLLPWMTVSQNVKFALKKDIDNADDLVSKTLNSTGLFGKDQCLPKTLSGGEQGRVAVARAIVNEPPLLLADEPTGSLDQATGKQLLDMLTHLNEGEQTVVMVTHDEQAAGYAQRIIRILDGRISVAQ